jgi:hypothetical protein
MASVRSAVLFLTLCSCSESFLPGHVKHAARVTTRTAPRPSSAAAVETDGERSRVLTKGQQNRAKKQGFILGELRPFAMKLHTRQQAPKEGGTIVKEERPMAKWEPTRAGYLQFLVDSREVYRTFEEVVQENEDLALLRNTGLERVAALDKDIPWLASDPSLGEPLEVPVVGEAGTAYAVIIRELSDDRPRLMNHFYNFYFAHTAGGRMIGKKLSEALLDGATLDFYQWPAAGEGEVKELLAATADKIDGMAQTWSREERDRCLEETAPAFKYGGSLLGYIK